MTKNFNLLCLLSLFSIVFLIIGKIEKWHFEMTYYLGLSLIALNFIYYLLIKKYFYYILGLTLLLGLCGLIHFFPFIMSFSIFGITIQIIPFLYILIYSYINRSYILDFLITSNVENEKQRLDSINRRKEIFRKEFENLSENELKSKLNLELTQEAKEVINEILEYKKATQ